MDVVQRFSKKRQAILDILAGTTSHPSAEWVYMQLKPVYPDLSLGTVYRNLAQFKEQGRIMSLGTVKGIERFDANTAPHVHFICDNCGCVDDLMDIHVPEELCRRASGENGARVNHCWLTFSGVCTKCVSQN